MLANAYTTNSVDSSKRKEEFFSEVAKRRWFRAQSSIQRRRLAWTWQWSGICRMTSSIKNFSAPHLARATADNTSIIKAFSASVASLRWSPRTAIGVSHESQSRIVNLNGWTNWQYRWV